MDGLFTRTDWDLDFKLTGKGTVIAIIDSGINMEHLAFQCRPADMPKILPAPDFSRNFNKTDQLDNDITDRIGHGTFCAGIAAGSSYALKFLGGIAPQAKLIVCRTDLSEDQVVQALSHLIDIQTRPEKRIKVHVVSMSFGFKTPDNRIEIKISDLKLKHGTIFVASAGNDGQRAPITYPGSSVNVICIGANNYYGHPTEFSTMGQKVFYLAPGKKILGPATHTQECLRRCCTCRQPPNHTSECAALRCECPRNHTSECAALRCKCPDEDKQALKCDKGTSFAAPAVAGLISLFTELAISEYETETLPFDVISKLLERSSLNQTLRPKAYLKELSESPGVLGTLYEQATGKQLKRRQRTQPLPLPPPPQLHPNSTPPPPQLHPTSTSHLNSTPTISNNLR